MPIHTVPIYLLEDLTALQQHLQQGREFYQVIASGDGSSHWQKMPAPQPEATGRHKPHSSPKSFFFAERENLFVFDGNCFRETLPETEPFVLFGVQACDLAAIAYQDRFFQADPCYQARRQQALLVGIDCTTPCPNGFCHVVDAGPGVSEDSADLILHPLPDNRWLLLEGSARGAAALAGFNPIPAGQHLLAQRDAALAQCVEQFADSSHISTGISKLNAGKVPAELWQTLAIQCLGCSGCTTLCPTCSCFGTRPIQADNGATTQQRFWDSCLYEGFQREASFHNPSQQAGDRVHRFWYHKFSDDFATKSGRYGCVGCGRCEQVCPGVIGVHSMMKRIAAHD